MGEILSTSPAVPEWFRAARTRTEDEDPRAAIEHCARMLMDLVSGRADILTGRHISQWNSIDELIRCADEIVRDDLYTLRLRELA